MLRVILFILQDLDIDKKLNQAPDDSYAVGVFLGNLLPFIILIAIAYLIYRYNKNRMKDDYNGK